MAYITILTHNPQDYFNGDEAAELVDSITLSRSDCGDYFKLLDAIDNGYSAIIVKVGTDHE